MAQVDATDPNSDALTYAFIDTNGNPFNTFTQAQHDIDATVPVGMRIDANSGLITWTPNSSQVTPADGQPYRYTIRVSDGQHHVTIGPVDLRVVSRLINGAPTITSNPRGLKAIEGAPLVYQATYSDPDGDPVIWSVTGASSVTIDPRTGRFVWIPPSNIKPGEVYEASITATDPYGASSTQTIQLQVSAGNAAPRIISQPPLPGNGGETWTYLVRATDADGDTMRFELVGNHSGITLTQLSNDSARVTWSNPTAEDSRTFTIEVIDGRGLKGQQNLTLTIGTVGGTAGSVDTPPTFTSNPIRTAVEGQVYQYRVTADDPDGLVSFDLGSGAPLWLSINSETGVLTGTNPEIGNHDVVVTASQAGTTVDQRFTLQVVEQGTGNHPPVIENSDGLLAYAGSPFVFHVVARDNDPGDILSYALVDDQGYETMQWNGFVIEQGGANAGRVSWSVPANAASGPRTFQVIVRDDKEGVSEPRSFTVNVLAAGADTAPSVALYFNTPNILPGHTILFAVYASDDLGVVDKYVVIEGALIPSNSLRLSAGLDGLFRYTVPADAEPSVFSAKAVAVDTSGKVSTTNPLPINVEAPDTTAPVIRIASPYAGTIINDITEINGAIFDLDFNLVYYAIKLRSI
ncbi:MAG: hypothetical protein HC898_12310 [Phycisphaerales bacterium]|nr:hypothetical protein [Phycisphaerales bacterium]